MSPPEKKSEDVAAAASDEPDALKEALRSGDKLSRFRQLFIAFTVSLGGATVGYSNSWMAIATPSLSDCEDNPNKPDGCTFDHEFNENQTSWIGSLYFLGMLASIPVMGAVMAFMGRRTSLIVVAVPMLIGLTILALAEPLTLDEVYWFYIARFLIGLGGGFLFTASVVYIHECVEPEIRGALGNLPVVLLTVNYFLGTLIGAMLPWYTMTQIGLVFPVLQLLSLFFVPETPFAYMVKKEPLKAKKSLYRLRGKDFDADRELERMQQALDEVLDEGKIGLLELITQAVYLKPLIIMLILGFLVQYTGQTGVSLYLTEIFIKAGFDADKSLYYSAAVASAQIFGSGTSALLVDRVGRKLILVLGSIGILVSMTALATYFYLDANLEVVCDNNAATSTTSEPCVAKDGFTQETLDAVSWLPVASLFAFKFSHAGSLSSIPGMMVGEFFASEAKDVSSTVSTVFSTLCAFTISQFQADMENLMTTAGLYYFYAAMAAVSALFCAFVVPETMGKSAKDMKRMFSNEDVHFDQQDGDDDESARRCSRWWGSLASSCGLDFSFGSPTPLSNAHASSVRRADSSSIYDDGSSRYNNPSRQVSTVSSIYSRMQSTMPGQEGLVA